MGPAPRALGRGRSAILCARIGFRVLPDGTLAGGRRYKLTHGVGTLLGKELLARCSGPLTNLLTSDGQKRLLEELRSHPVTQPPRARPGLQERLQFIREHPELQRDLNQLASAMKDAELYSSNTQVG